MTNKKTSTNFLIQGSILAFAGILVRVIGLVYRIPLNNILGTEGVTYYSTAYEIYSVLLLLSSQSMPLAVSKLVSASLVKGEYKNADKLFKGALVYGLVIGLFFGLIAYFGADVLAGIYKYPSCARALRVLAPTITIVSILGVFRGYFQGMGNMAPTAISQVIEQIVNAIVSVFAAYYLYSFGMNIEVDTEAAAIKNASSYSAAGGTLGTCLGALGALLILLTIYIKARKQIKENIINSNNLNSIPYGKIFKMLLFTITPVLLSTVIYQIGGLIDSAIYSNIKEGYFAVSETDRARLWGVYVGNYRLLTTMPIAIASAISVSIIPTIVKSFTERNIDMVKNKVNMAIRFVMIIAIPCGIGLSVLGGPINELLFDVDEYQSLITKIMLLSICPVVAFSLSTITNSILQGIDKLRVPLINSGISLIIHLILLPILLIVFKLDIYGVAIGDFIFSLVICILNARAINNVLVYKQELINTFVKPMISGAIMGTVSYGVYWCLKILFINAGYGEKASNGISVIFAIIIAIITYFVVLIKIKGVNEEILKSFPKGEIVVGICKKIHLL